jgi:hypothetical protein
MKEDTTYDAVVLLGGVVDDSGIEAFASAPPATTSSGFSPPTMCFERIARRPRF